MIFIDCQSLSKKSVGHSVFLENILLNLDISNLNKIILGVESKKKLNPHLIKKYITYKYFFNNQFIRRFLEIPIVCLVKKCNTVITSFVAPLVPKINKIIIVHDIGYIIHPEYYNYLFRIKIKLLTKLSIITGSSIITVSEFSKQSIINYYKVKDNRISIVPNGVDLDKFSDYNDKFDKTVLDENNINKKFVLFVGTLQPRKNINGIIDAFTKFINLYNLDMLLLLVGANGWKIDNLLTKIKKNKNIIQLENISDNNLPSFYRQAEIFLYPSHFEGFGIPVIEAMASRTPVITSNNSSLPEISGDGAILVDSKDTNDIFESLVAVYKDKILQERLVLSGFEQASKYSWKLAAKKFKKALS